MGPQAILNICHMQGGSCHLAWWALVVSCLSLFTMRFSTLGMWSAINSILRLHANSHICCATSCNNIEGVPPLLLIYKIAIALSDKILTFLSFNYLYGLEDYVISIA